MTDKWYLLPLALVASSVFAQAPQGMDSQRMQAMMEGMAQMAACYEKLDQGKLEALAEEGKALEEELKGLCAQGERDRAQQAAVEYGLRFMGSDEFQLLKSCGEMAGQFTANMPDYSVYADEAESSAQNRHVCDEF